MESAVKSEQYWEQLSVLPTDLEFLVNLLLEEEEPKTLDALARAMVWRRHQQLLDLVRESLSQGRIYRPSEAYEVGESVIFPHMGNWLGEVVAIRPGRNPEYESFSVMCIRGEDGVEREYAAELGMRHPLDDAQYTPAADVGPEELYERYGVRVRRLLFEALEVAPQFVMVADKWFVKELLMEVSPMQLNIAEAMLDMVQGGPLPAEAFLAEMELPDEISEPLQIFSLECALIQDPRFDEVGPTGQGLWYLKRMEPPQVLEIPSHLRYVPIPYNRGLLDDVMFSLEKQIDDEWSELAFSGAPLGPDSMVTVTLSYPHWRSGTLPLTGRLARIFPTARLTDHIRFTFIDGDNGATFPGWVVRSGRYVYGLEAWYEDYNVGPGAYIDLGLGAEPGEIKIAARPFRSRRGEWLRTVTVHDDQFSFEVTRYPVFCEFDELTALGVPDPGAVDSLAQKFRRIPLESLVERVFQALAVLSLQRAVHGATLYSALNLFRRVPPASMQAVLAIGQQYVSLGDNYWSYRGDF
ncbi:MAG: hypothetical protein JXB35_16915 [Anaerolineae bacterium]|nr:hypothetical protein [Anaerolineae bacterium]